MSVKKTLLLGCMAVAIAVPAAAVAEEEEAALTNWTMEGKPETASRAIQVTGKAKISASAGEGFECDLKTKVTANVGGASSTGILHFNVVELSCTPFGATFKGCRVWNLAGTNSEETLTFEYHLTTTKPSKTREIYVTNPEFTLLLEKCDKPGHAKVAFKSGSWTETPNNPDKIETVSLQGEAKVKVENEAEVAGGTIEGTLEVMGEIEGKPAKGTFGIEE